MSLLKKCLYFLVTIMILQMLVFAGFAVALFKAEQSAERVVYSNRIVSAHMQITEAFYGSAHALMMLAVNHDPAWGARVDQLFFGLPSLISELRADRFADPQDKQDLDEIGKIVTYVIGELRAGRRSFEKASSPSEFVSMWKLYTLETNPHLTDLMEVTKKLADRHRALQRYASEQKHLIDLLRSIIVAGFMLNITTTAALVIGFSRGINRRIGLIADNFSKHVKNKPLNPPQAGGDEIALLDGKFHELSDALSEASEKDKAVFANLPVALVTVMGDGKIENLNPRGEVLFSFTDEQLLEISNLLASNTDIENVRDCIENQRAVPLRVTCRRADGTTFPAELSISAFQHKGEKRALLAVLDISDREKIESMRRELVAIVSHDIRSPLTSIRACLTLFEHGSFGSIDERGLHNIKIAQRESDRLMRLTTDLLELAKIEAGGVALEPRKCAAFDVMTDAADAVSHMAMQKAVSIVVEPNKLEFYADRERVVQILVNFLSNAIKFSSPGKGIVMIAQIIGTNIRISVTDEGCGIPEAYLGRVFDRFKQVRRDDAKSGTGLGLAICRMLAEQHGGTVGVTSEEGSGSTFWVQLPEQFMGQAMLAP